MAKIPSKIQAKIAKVPKVKEKFVEVQKEIVGNLKSGLVEPGTKKIDAVLEKIKGQEFLQTPGVKTLMDRVKSKIDDIAPNPEEVVAKVTAAIPKEEEIKESAKRSLSKLSSPFTDGAEFAKQLGQRIMKTADEVKHGLIESKNKLSKKAAKTARAGTKKLSGLAPASLSKKSVAKKSKKGSVKKTAVRAKRKKS